MENPLSYQRAHPGSRKIWKKHVLWVTIWIVFPLCMSYLIIGAIAADQLTIPLRVFYAGYTPAEAAMAYEDVRFPARDGQAAIAAWHIPSLQNQRVVVLVHGRNASRSELFMGRALDLAAALHRAGLSVIMIDLRGHGQSSDARFTHGLAERYDVVGAVDWLASQGYQAGKIGVMGLSLGAAAAIGAAAEDDRIGALVSDSGFAEIASLIQSRWMDESGLPGIFLPATRLMIWLKFGYDISASRPVDDIAKVAPRPILLVACANDKDIPYRHTLQLLSAAPGAQLWTIPDCIHGQSYNAGPDEYEQRLVKFFTEGLQ